MLRSFARVGRIRIGPPFERCGAGSAGEQSRAISRSREERRLGAGVVGKFVPCTWLQAQCLADATFGRTEYALASIESWPSEWDVTGLQARLFGTSGLLPDELPRKGSDDYLRKIWDIWWRERDAFSDVVLPRAAWKFHGVRPVNHPSRRLALASHWLADNKFISKIESWIADGKEDATPAATSAGLNRILQVNLDDFWSWHITFKSARSKKPQPLLGDARVTDLAVNVILPWLWIRAVEGGNEKIQKEIERRYFAWPPAEDNSILKLARQRLLGTSNAKFLKTAAAQQGLIQIVRDFCEHSNAACDECQFPELVRGWAASRSGR